MKKEQFRKFIREMYAMLKKKGLSAKDTAEIMCISPGLLYNYMAECKTHRCPEKKQNGIIQKFKEFVGEDKVQIVLDKYDVVQSVSMSDEEENIQVATTPAISLNSEPTAMEKTLQMMTNRRDSITKNIEDLTSQLNSLKEEEQTLNTAIDALSKVQYINIV